jgi:hypothetical protein
VVGYLALGRYRESARAQDLLLACGLAILAVANLVLTAVPAAVALSGGSELTRWTPLLVRVFGTASSPPPRWWGPSGWSGETVRRSCSEPLPPASSWLCSAGCSWA